MQWKSISSGTTIFTSFTLFFTYYTLNDVGKKYKSTACAIKYERERKKIMWYVKMNSKKSIAASCCVL